MRAGPGGAELGRERTITLVNTHETGALTELDNSHDACCVSRWYLKRRPPQGQPEADSDPLQWSGDNGTISKIRRESADLETCIRRLRIHVAIASASLGKQNENFVEMRSCKKREASECLRLIRNRRVMTFEEPG